MDKLRKCELKTVRRIMRDIEMSVHDCAAMAGQHGEKVLIEDSEMDGNMAKIYADACMKLRDAFRTLSQVEDSIESTKPARGILGWRIPQTTAQ
mgnify:CR=1 FL=1|tara:strand:+ start:260 stop:541 length:282 start_codon:yes stop_codon:yes gene_type:complete